MSNGGMQHSRDCPVMAAPCACTTGGNTMVINGDEAKALDAAIEATPVESSPLGEDDSHVMGEWATGIANFAGS